MAASNFSNPKTRARPLPTRRALPDGDREVSMVKSSHSFDTLPPIKVVGVGGAGCNAVTRMAAEKIPGVQLLAVNTDSQALSLVNADMQIRIGDKLTKG